jgi:hypothetical protein
MKRRRNQHNLRHGLYAQRITQDEQTVLDAQPVASLEGEIAYLRALIGRLALILERNGLAAGSTRQLSDDTRRTMAALDSAMSRLLKYVRQHALLSGQAGDYEALVESGKLMAREEMGVMRFLEEGGEEADASARVLP